MADRGEKPDNTPRKPISEEEYKKGLISDIRPIQVRQEKKELSDNLTSDTGDFIGDEELEDEDQEILDEEQPEEERDDQQELNRDDIERLTRDQRIKEVPEQQLEKGKVPEYKVEPPEAYKRSPGGPAVKPRSPVGSATKAGEGVAKTGQETARAAQKTGQAVTKAGQAMAKVIQSAVAAIRTAVAAIGALLSSAPAWLPVVLIILGILIIIGAVVIFLKARQTPNAGGASPTIVADPITERPWFQKVLLLAGDQNIAQKMTDEILVGLETDLSGLERDMQREPYSSYPEPIKIQIDQKIAEIRNLISRLRTTSVISTDRKTIVNEIVTKLEEIIKLFSPAPFYYSAGPGKTTAYPVRPSTIRGYTNTLHCETRIRPSGDCGRHRTFHQFKKDTADAVDIFAPAGTPIYAAFGGEVIKRGNSNGTYLKIRGTDAEGKTFLAVYAHLNTNLRAGNAVNTGDEIGTMYPLTISSPHLHFELYCNERAVVTLNEDVIDHSKSDNKYESIGEYLYIRMLNVLHLAQH
jgi:murein DD-endopeptidase MepM/ murein hydrolase activator NlpD